MLGLVVVMATAGKFIGCAGTARLNGIPWRESCVIGILMNTRGLVELIVLNLGLQAKILDVEIFTIVRTHPPTLLLFPFSFSFSFSLPTHPPTYPPKQMVMMALLTTFITVSQCRR